MNRLRNQMGKSRKLPIDSVNVWYSPHIKKWSVCALVRVDTSNLPGVLFRRKTTHKSLKLAMTYIKDSYKDQ
jgi:hypothetical protein